MLCLQRLAIRFLPTAVQIQSLPNFCMAAQTLWARKSRVWRNVIWNSSEGSGSPNVAGQRHYERDSGSLSLKDTQPDKHNPGRTKDYVMDTSKYVLILLLCSVAALSQNKNEKRMCTFNQRQTDRY